MWERLGTRLVTLERTLLPGNTLAAVYDNGWNLHTRYEQYVEDAYVEYLREKNRTDDVS